MPNGHGGYPFMGSPVLLAGALVLALAIRPASQAWATLRPGVCIALAALLGWRLAYHLHMRNADEYGGAYVSESERRIIVRRYRLLAVAYMAASLTVTALLLRVRP